MDSLRELTRSQGKPCNFKQWAEARKIVSFPISLRQIMNAYASPTIWGFADLHAHPASHLAFGADANGNNGLFWGKPATSNIENGIETGLQLENSSLPVDLPACDAYRHCGDCGDLIKDNGRPKIIKSLEKFTPHTWFGMPTFAGWPSASSVTHQQMHISSVRRAWEGGLRLMIASVTDNQTISMLWNRGVDYAPSWPVPHNNFDFLSAKSQLNFIHQLVEANSDWMEIVLTAEQARIAVRDHDKLAVILSVEMDMLTAEQILMLKDDPFGVRHVVPIHLANNSFGGVAVYDDAFNTNNWYLHGGHRGNPNDPHQLELFYQVQVGRNSKLNFTLDPPQFLRLETDWTPWDGVGSVNPTYVNASDYVNLKYLDPPDTLGFGIGLHDELAAIDNRVDQTKNPVSIPDGLLREYFKSHSKTLSPGAEINTLERGLVWIIVDPLDPPLKYHLMLEGNELFIFTGSPNWGNQNQTGINESEILKLMRNGLMIDLAHMSENSQKEMLDLAEPKNYPLMNSHSGMRPREGIQSERDMPKDLVERLAAKGGVFGTSSSGYRDPSGKPKGNQLEQWIADYYVIWNAMKFRGVVLGTDINGLSPSIPGSEKEVAYPLIIQTPKGSYELPNSVAGQKVFIFPRDGIAHYGMLADFIQALSQYDSSEDGLGADIGEHFLFRTAEETINMWEKVEQAAKGC